MQGLAKTSDYGVVRGVPELRGMARSFVKLTQYQRINMRVLLPHPAPALVQLT